MGTDKALLRLQPSGPRIIELILAAVEPLVGSIVISTNRPTAYNDLGWPLVCDNYPEAGPLAGLEAGLTAAQAQYNLTLACDMPFIAPALMSYLLTEAEGYAAVVPIGPEGRPEPLCAVYSRDCLPSIRQALGEGSFKMTGWLDKVAVRFVSLNELAPFDPVGHSFKNLNTPEDLKASLEL